MARIYIRRIFLFYLPLVPFIAAGLGLGVGHVDYTIYLPLWIIHTCIMLYGLWILGLRKIRSNNEDERRTAAIGLFFTLPWVLAAIFGGMGPPPFTVKGWAELALEQQVRFGILIACGIFIALGFSMLREHLKSRNELFYCRLGITCASLAIPLFMFTTAAWGTFVTYAFKLMASTSGEQPEWFGPIVHLIEFIVYVWVALLYITTGLFAVSIKKAALLTSKASNAYLFVSLFALVVSFAPSSSLEPFATLGYIVAIPAITFVMPYLIGLNLLKKLPG